MSSSSTDSGVGGGAINSNSGAINSSTAVHREGAINSTRDSHAHREERGGAINSSSVSPHITNNMNLALWVGGSHATHSGG